MAHLAGANDGVVSLAHATAAGIDRRVLRRAARDGLIVPIRTGVFRFAATPLTPKRHIRAAVLSVGSAARASHESCLHLHGVTNIELDETAVSVPPGHRADHPGIRIHRFVDQHPEHMAEIDGIPTTSLARGIVDVSSVFKIARLEFVVDQVTVTKRLVTLGAIARVFRQVNHRGRRSIAMLDDVLEERLALGSIDRSTLERQADRLLATTDLPTPVKEYPVPSLVPGEGFADRAWEDAQLILEIDGRTHHERRLAMRRDRARDRAAGVVGWHTMRVLDEEVDQEPDLVVADVVGTYRQRMLQLHGVVV